MILDMSKAGRSNFSSTAGNACVTCTAMPSLVVYMLVLDTGGPYSIRVYMTGSANSAFSEHLTACFSSQASRMLLLCTIGLGLKPVSQTYTCMLSWADALEIFRGTDHRRRFQGSPCGRMLSQPQSSRPPGTCGTKPRTAGSQSCTAPCDPAPPSAWTPAPDKRASPPA